VTDFLKFLTHQEQQEIGYEAQRALAETDAEAEADTPSHN
jgi:hypothetical protein